MVNYRSASFRGVTFEVKERSFTSGRRTQVHEYPNKDTPYTEDMGKKAQNFQVQAFVIGETFAARRDALIRACERQGAGILIHPDYGTKNVICDGISIKESSEQRRMAVIDLTFIEAGEKAMSSVATDWLGSITDSAHALIDSAHDSFVSVYRISAGVTDLVGLIGGISDTLIDVVEGISSGIGYTNGLKSDITGNLNGVADVIKTATGMKKNAKVYAAAPAQMAEAIEGSYATVTELASKSDSNTTTTLDHIKSGVDVKSFKTVQKLASASNASKTVSEDGTAEKLCMQQIEQFTKQLVVACEAEVITNIQFTNTDEASEVLEQFLTDVEEIEFFEDIEPSNDIIEALRDLKRGVVEYVREIIVNLPQTKTINLGETMPSLVLAYDLYEDLDRADEIVKKNAVKYPQFLPANKDLKVLTK